jgi:signal transduction histidine kinase
VAETALLRVGAQNLRESAQEETPLLQALDSLRVAIAVFDSELRLEYANAHLGYIFRGLPPISSLIGKRYAELLRLELPEIAPASLTGGPEQFIAFCLAQLGDQAWAPRDIFLLDGRIIEIKARRDRMGRFVLLWNDVTDARQQFGRLEEAIRLSADAFAFYDSHDRFVTGNALYADLADVPLEQLKGQSFEQIVRRVAATGHVVMDLPEEEWVARRVRRHTTVKAADTLQTASGNAYLVRDCSTPDGGRALVFTDITEKTRAENALAQTQSVLESTRDAAQRQTGYLADLTKRLNSATAQADNAKTMLLRTMSHELKTPLNAILGFSDLMNALADNLAPAQIREYAGLIHHGGSNLLKMLNQIMDLTKISAGRYELRKVPVDAGSILWLARENFSAKAEIKQIAIDAENCPAGLLVASDETVLGSMLNALLDNAITFTQQGGTVILSAAQCADGVRLTVTDNGPGVAAADLIRIQQPFEHAGRVADHASGAGLGLTLVKAFAELHGGRLEIESSPGEGFAAIVTIPTI